MRLLTDTKSVLCCVNLNKVVKLVTGKIGVILLVWRFNQFNPGYSVGGKFNGHQAPPD
jgi:hypothetical protein